MPVLQLNTTHDGPWECDTCCEDYNAKTDQPWETIDGGDLVCTTCIRQQFERALELDYNWPARWGGDELLISDFESTFSPELVSQVKDKAAEMAAIDKDALLEAVKDLTRGKDYQICPGCKQTVDLGSGCNHMTCHFCHTNFCFLCGEEVKRPEATDHWTVSRNICPRYGPVGSAMFDPTDDDDEHEQFTPLTHEQRMEVLAIMTQRLSQTGDERADFREFTAFYIDTWAWNLAMQSLRDDRIGQDHLRMVLEQEDGGPLWVNFEALLRGYRPEHAVPEQEWAELFQAGLPQIRRLFDNGPRIPGYPEESDFLDHGMLTQPVGGVFNMMSPASRLEAFMWMYNTTRDWENLDVSQRSAVFDMGPGDDDMMRERVGDLMDHMRLQRWFEIFTFLPMHNAGVLVTVEAPRSVRNNDGSVWLPTEAWWRVVLVRQIWGFLVHLDRDMAQDLDNPQWLALVRESGGAWNEQRPQAWAQRVFPESDSEDDEDDSEDDDDDSEDEQDDQSTGNIAEDTTGW